MPGVYVLRLTADDSELTASDDVTITVSAPANQAPVVDAGPDSSVTLPDTIKLQGTVSDDGYPNPPAAVTVLWKAISGPGVVTFNDDTILEPYYQLYNGRYLCAAINGR